MREILFRGKRIDNGEWHYGSLICDGSELSIYDCNNDIQYIGEEVEPETVGQFTGLHDKNGVNIFEGDSVNIIDPYNGCTAKGSAEVVFSTEYVGGWVATVDNKNFLNIGSRCNFVIVIGNIHDKK